METYTTEEYQYVFDDIEFEQYIQSHDTTQPIIIGDIIVNEGTEMQQHSGTIKSNQTSEKSKNEQNSNIETSHQLGLHSVLDCLHDQVCTALRDDVSDNSCGLRIRHQMPRKNIRMGSESIFFENSEVAHRSENNIQCTAVKMGKSPILFDKLDYPPYLVTNVPDNQNGEFRKATSAYGNESRDSNMDNRTLISQVQANERLYQGGDNTVKRNESTANTVIMVGGNESRVSNTDNRTPIAQAKTNERLYQGGNNSVKRKESITNTGTVIMVDDNGSRVSNTVNRTPISQAPTNERLYQGGNNSVKRKESITNTSTVIMVDGNESRVSNTVNRTPISQAKTNEILYQGGNNSVKRKESITNTVINNLFSCGDAHDIDTTGKQSTGSVITEGSGYNPHTLFKNNESPVMKRPYRDTGDTRNSSKEKFQCIKRPKINTRINHKKYFEKNNIYFMEIWKHNLSIRTLACGEFKCNNKHISKNLVDITDLLVGGFMSADEKFVQHASGVAKFENQDTISSGNLQELCSQFIVKLGIFTVEFSKCILTFLPSGDDEKKIQIKECLLEIAVIYSVYWRLVRKSDMFLEVYGLDTEKCKLLRMGQLGVLLDNLLYTIAALNLLELNKEELVLLAAMILLSPDRHGSTKESNTQLKKLEEVMCVALKYNMFLLHPGSPSCLFEKTIRTLIDIRMLSELHLENFLQSQIA